MFKQLLPLLILTTSAHPSIFKKIKHKAKKIVVKTTEQIDKKAKKFNFDRKGTLSLRIKTEERFGKLDSLHESEKNFLFSFDRNCDWIASIPKKGGNSARIKEILSTIPLNQSHPTIKAASEYLIESIVCTGTLGSEQNLRYISQYLALLSTFSSSGHRFNLLCNLTFPHFKLIYPYRIVLAANFNHPLLTTNAARSYFDHWATQSITLNKDEKGRRFIQIRYHDWLGYEADKKHVWRSNQYIPSFLVAPILARMHHIRRQTKGSLFWDANSHGTYVHDGKRYWYSGEVGYPKAQGEYKGYLYPLAKQIKEEKICARIIHHGALIATEFPED